MGARRRTVVILPLPMLLSDFVVVGMATAEAYADARIGTDDEGRTVITTALHPDRADRAPADPLTLDLGDDE